MDVVSKTFDVHRRIPMSLLCGTASSKQKPVGAKRSRVQLWMLDVGVCVLLRVLLSVATHGRPVPRNKLTYSVVAGGGPDGEQSIIVPSWDR